MADPVVIDATRELHAPASAVWAVLEDLSRLPEWLAFAKDVEGVEGGPARWLDLHGQAGWGVRADHPLADRRGPAGPPPAPHERDAAHQGRDLGDRAAGWRRRRNARARPLAGRPKNLMGRLVRPVFQKRIQRNWEKSLERLDEVAAGAAPPGTA